MSPAWRLARPTRAGELRGYGVAVVAGAVAVWLRWLVDPLLGAYVPFATLYAAVAVAVWYGGYRPALIVVLLGYLASNYLFIEPRGTFSIANTRDYVGLGLYVFSSFIIIGFGEGMQSARRRAEASEQDALRRQEQLEREIAERRRAEDALAHADRRKDEFLAMLAHELRNPLAPIRNALHLLHLEGRPAAEAQWCREVIDRQVGHMARLLDDLLDVGRITANKLELRKERVALTAVVERALEASQPFIESAGHQLTVVLPPEPVQLEADPVRIAQVLSNLLNNAARYTKAGGNIRLKAVLEAGELVLSIEDNGIGISAEMLPHVFEMFAQGDSGVIGYSGGLGIGLALARGLVAAHGGTIEGRSRGPGRGSEFVVRLPLAADIPEHKRLSSAEEIAPPTPTPRRLLIADDLEDNAQSLAMIFRDMGHEVHTAEDGELAVAAAEKFRPEVALLDLEMPKLNGYDACRRIRSEPWGKAMVLIAVTGSGQEDDRRRAEEAGFSHHVVKPVEPLALQALLASSRPAD